MNIVGERVSTDYLLTLIGEREVQISLLRAEIERLRLREKLAAAQAPPVQEFAAHHPV